MTRDPSPELSRRIAVAEIGADGLDCRIDADAEERRRLAERFDLIELPELAAELRLDPVGGGEIALSGSFRAHVVQRCVVSGAPVEADVEGTVERLFAPAEDIAPPPREEEVTADELEPPEAIIDDVVEIGEAVAEEMALALDPFPRAKGAEFRGFESGPDDRDAGDGGPFAKLAELRRRSRD